MPKQGKMFPGITRQVVISDETHQLLVVAAQDENKYIGELADELIGAALRRRQTRRQTRLQSADSADCCAHPSTAVHGPRADAEDHGPPLAGDERPHTLAQRRGAETTLQVAPVERLPLATSRIYYKYHCLVCGREWIGGGEPGTPRAEVPQRCNYPDCRSSVWNDPVAAAAARQKRQRQ